MLFDSRSRSAAGAEVAGRKTRRPPTAGPGSSRPKVGGCGGTRRGSTPQASDRRGGRSRRHRAFRQASWAGQLSLLLLALPVADLGRVAPPRGPAGLQQAFPSAPIPTPCRRMRTGSSFPFPPESISKRTYTCTMGGNTTSIPGYTYSPCKTNLDGDGKTYCATEWCSRSRRLLRAPRRCSTHRTMSAWWGWTEDASVRSAHLYGEGVDAPLKRRGQRLTTTRLV
ncbi:hypothetical protein ACHAWF_017204 [Thalassiosira exigua]